MSDILPTLKKDLKNIILTTKDILAKPTTGILYILKYSITKKKLIPENVKLKLGKASL